MGLTTDDLIAQIKRRVSVPASQIKYQNADFIAFLNNALESKIVPQLIAVDEDFFVASMDIPLVASQSAYRVPAMSVCWVLHEIGYVDTNGNYRVLPRMTQGRLLVDSENQPLGFYLQDGNIMTAPLMGTGATGSLRVYFYKRLNDLVSVASCGKIENVVDAFPDYTITVDNPPIGLTLGIDVIKGSSPYEVATVKATATIIGNTITAAQSEFDSVPEVGDWIAQTGTAPIPHLPDAWHYVLADFGARKCLIGNADEKIIALLDQDISEDLAGIKQVVKNRAKGSPRKRVSRNPFLIMSRGRR